jgi:hypothetical protein
MDSIRQKYGYKDRTVIPCSYKLRSGEWSPRAKIMSINADTVTFSPIYSKNAMTFSEEADANVYALRLAAMWIDSKQ